MTTISSAETTNIQAARTFLTTLAAHLQHLTRLAGTARSHLAGKGLDTSTLNRIEAIRRQLDALAGTCTSGAGHLTGYHGQMEQAVNSTPEAADVGFYRHGPHCSASPASKAAGSAAGPAAPSQVPAVWCRDDTPGRLQLGDGPDAAVIDWSGGDISGPRTLVVGQGPERAAVQMRRSELAELIDVLDKLQQLGASYDEMPLAGGGTIRWGDWDEADDGSPVLHLSVADDQGGFGCVDLDPRQVSDLQTGFQRQLAADSLARDRAAGIRPGELNPDDLLFDDGQDTYAAAAQRHRQVADWYATLDQNDRETASQMAWFAKAADTLDAAAARQSAAGRPGQEG